MHTELSLLIREGDFWWVNNEMGEETGWLRAKVVKSEVDDQPPVKGWQYIGGGGSWWRGGGKYEVDATLVCSRQVSTPCTEVKVELQGEAKKKRPDYAGTYKLVKGKMNRGRWVGFLINQHLFAKHNNCH